MQNSPSSDICSGLSPCHLCTACLHLNLIGLNTLTSAGWMMCVAFGYRQYSSIPFSAQKLLKWRVRWVSAPSMKKRTGFFIPFSSSHGFRMLTTYLDSSALINLLGSSGMSSFPFSRMYDLNSSNHDRRWCSVTSALALLTGSAVRTATSGCRRRKARIREVTHCLCIILLYTIVVTCFKGCVIWPNRFSNSWVVYRIAMTTGVATHIVSQWQKLKINKTQ